jgi:DNA (cytosine-5)-methyltransferase 1
LLLSKENAILVSCHLKGTQKTTMERVDSNRPMVVDLYSGVGGLSLGFDQAGFNVAVNVEIEEIAGRYAQYNFPHSKVLYGEKLGDVRKLTRESFTNLGFSTGQVFAVVGGPPCQGFSLAGKRRNDDPLNELVLEFARVVTEFNPLVFLMENVPGLKTSDSPMLGSALKLLGKKYDFVGPQTLRAWEYGVPQMRQRVFILGIQKALKISPSLPEATHFRPTDMPTLFTKRCPSSWDAISDIPDVDSFAELISGDRVIYTEQPRNDFQRFMRRCKQDPNDFGPIVEWDENICTNLRRTQHGKSLARRFAKLGFGESDGTCGIRRLDPEDISTTIRAGTTKARGSWSAPRPLHPYQNRVLTTRECARIQSFPDWFFFHPVKWHGNRMVGNAVPPLLARAIGQHIRSLFKLPAPCQFADIIKRDESLVGHDIVAAKESGYENRKVSQLVVSWKGRHCKKPLS